MSGKPAPALDVLIVGAGFAGIYMLFKARRIGLDARLNRFATPLIHDSARHGCFWSNALSPFFGEETSLPGVKVAAEGVR